MAVSITPLKRGGLELILLRTAWLFEYLGVLVVGVLVIRALVVGVYMKAPDFLGNSEKSCFNS